MLKIRTNALALDAIFSARAPPCFFRLEGASIVAPLRPGGLDVDADDDDAPRPGSLDVDAHDDGAPVPGSLFVDADGDDATELLRHGAVAIGHDLQAVGRDPVNNPGGAC
jgi:hypothetical protein